VSVNTDIDDNAFEGCDALEALAAPYDMDVKTYLLIQLPLLRSAFYHFLFCENDKSLLSGNEDVMRVIAGFLFVVPTPPPVADDYVLPTAADVAERLEEQLERQRLLLQLITSVTRC